MTLRSATSSTDDRRPDGVVRASGVIVESIYLGTGHRCTCASTTAPS